MGTSQSKIIVNSGVEFTIEDSQVSGCGSNWHEIRIESGVSQIDKLREQLRDKQSELMAVYQNMENVYDNNNSLIIKDEINTLTHTLESITSAKSDYIISQIKNLRVLNEGINVYGYESDDHMKRINTLNLNILESNGKEFSLSPKDSEWLSYIANACVDNVGNSKFAAQS